MLKKRTKGRKRNPVLPETLDQEQNARNMSCRTQEHLSEPAEDGPIPNCPCMHELRLYAMSTTQTLSCKSTEHRTSTSTCWCNGVPLVGAGSELPNSASDI